VSALSSVFDTEGKEAMVLQANKWGWKALAAKMLLAPVLAGSLAVPAFAQQPASRTTPAQQQPSQDPAQLLKLGRQSLKDGKFDDAAGYARQADAANPTGKWGLFGDTPAALLKDTDLGRQKADKALAAQLTKEARELVNKGGRTDAEKLAHLDAAAGKLDKALTLAGKGDWTDGLNVFADKPDALKKDVDTARAALRKNTPGVVTADARGTAPDTSKPATAIRQTKFELEQPVSVHPGGTTSPAKTQAAELVKAGRGLLVDGKLVEARGKFADAAKLGVTFGFSEDNPEKGLQDVAVKGKAKVDGLVATAKGFSAKNEYQKADLALTDAKQLVVSLDLWAGEVDLEIDAVRKAAGQVKADVAQTTPADAPLPVLPSIEPPRAADPPMAVELPKTVDAPKPAEKIKPVDVDVPGLQLPVEPKLPPPEVKAEPKTAEPKEDPAASAAKKKAEEGKKMLEQANELLKQGEFDMATKLAVKVHNGEYGLQEDAQKLMVAVDTERKAAKGKESVQALAAAAEAVSLKQFAYADRLLAQIDDGSLPKDKQEESKKLRDGVAKELAAAKAALAPPPIDTPNPTPPAAGNLIPSTPAGPGIESAKTAMEAEAQQLRSESLQVQARALKLFEQGDTDQAVQLLADLATKVKASKLTPARQQTILDPIEAKLDNFRLIKRQVDLYTKDVKEKQERMTNRLQKATADQQRQEEIAKRVADIKELMEKKNFADAEKLALQAKQLDPDNQTLNLVYELAKRNRRMDDANRLRDDKEEAVLDILNEADSLKNVPTDEDPIKFSMKRALSNRGRPGGDDVYSRPRTAVEREIELKLDRPMKVNFKQASLREVLDKFADTAQMNLSVDEPAVAAAGLELEKVLVSENIVQPISMRSIMQVILEKHQLQYLVENDMVVVTTQKKAKGRMYTKVFSVTELVTPIPDFAIPEAYSLEKMLTKSITPTQPWVDATAAARQALGNGQLVSGGGLTPPAGMGGGTLQNVPGGPQTHPIGASATLAPTKSNHSEQLMKLVKGMVRPHTWDEQGGGGKLAYYDIGGALVVNQTADVISEVNNLLESLRRLQDLSVSVEVRLISLSEAFFERIGVDFQMNIKTNGKTEGFEPALTTSSFRPVPFINDISNTGVITGWNPNQGGFTPDLDIPIRPNSYGFSVPPFGNYPGNGNGGLNLGLAFLNDIQVFMFLEAAAGDRRTNIMQAPKITCFNGQTSSVNVGVSQFFVTGLQVFNVGGQFVYLPTNTPFFLGVNMVVQPVVSSDRRFVRLTINQTFTENNPDATVPLFPITAFITPVFEGGSQGTPIPFTQFFQQPTTTTITVSTTVVAPDGGTVVLGGLKTMSEGRNEFGPPMLSQVPYLNRLFKNTGVGRDTRHIMMMVTPRIIITTEEEQLATGQGVGLGTGN
jgi:type II secretory pathway component GspD/PulD (secretin)